MGVNKNISIFMLFDCVRVNTGLVFIESVIVGEKRGGEVYVNWWWYQSWIIFLYYACWSFLIGENISIWMTPFHFESSCDRDGGMWWIILHRGGHIWSFFRRDAGNSFTTSHTATRASSWPYMDFWTFKFFVTSVPGWGYVLIWHMGGSTHIWVSPSLHRFLGGLKNLTPYYS